MIEPVSSPHSLPVYAQVAERLQRDIAAGRLIDGERLPPERVMAQSLDVSVGTLRKALALLEQKSLLRRVQGSGNYVDAAGMRDTLYAMFRLELPQGGGLPTATVLSVDVLTKPEDLPQFGTSDRATRMRRLRQLDQIEIAVEEIWLDAGAGTLTQDQVFPSLYDTYQRQLGLWISRAEDRVTLGAVPDWANGTFHMRSGVAVGFAERYSWSQDATPVEYSRTWFDPVRAVYVQRIL
ncbi:MAG: GntR family transcriptional regulator [Paracoccaceae bacterium]